MIQLFRLLQQEEGWQGEAVGRHPDLDQHEHEQLYEQDDERQDQDSQAPSHRRQEGPETVLEARREREVVGHMKLCLLIISDYLQRFWRWRAPQPAAAEAEGCPGGGEEEGGAGRRPQQRQLLLHLQRRRGRQQQQQQQQHLGSGRRAQRQ